MAVSGLAGMYWPRSEMDATWVAEKVTSVWVVAVSVSVPLP
jgi:hypothetical protein